MNKCAVPASPSGLEEVAEQPPAQFALVPFLIALPYEQDGLGLSAPSAVQN